MAGNEKEVLVVMNAHPDDICCVGGIAAKYSAEGHKVYSLSVTLGETIRKPGPEQEKVKQLRKAEGIEIARILGAEFIHLDVPSNKIIPTMEMKMKIVNAIRKIGGNIVMLFTTPWDVHADHRNLSCTMRDVTYYVGHPGIKGEHEACRLAGAYMYEIETHHNELHEPDLVIDITDHAEKKFESFLGGARAVVYGPDSGKAWMEQEKAWVRFWGMRYGVKYAEPLYAARGSMDTMIPVRKIKLKDKLPVI
ncbi:MAG: PIG-L family deacetylase [Planctomycetes bacterium]|nr:PIG-L family deacetylase [Planctomycetota bacterium]